MPTLAPAWVADDWLYGRSVEILLRDHDLRILHLSVATVVFQVLWGSLFALPFGPTAGVLRVSTLVLCAFGGLGVYGLCRELGVRRAGATLGAAVFLFNPLAYVLGFSFMSDMPFGSLLAVSCYWYARGFGRDQPGAVVAGSAVAALAFLVRQQGLLIPAGVLTWLVLSRRLRLDRQSLVNSVRVAGLPVLAAAGYFMWITFVHGVPAAQTRLLDQLRLAGFGGVAVSTAQLAFMVAMYVGLFVLPVAAVALTVIRRPPAPERRRWAVLLLPWAGVVGVGVVLATAVGWRMPYISQFLAPWGLGPTDVRGGRPHLLGTPARLVLTGVVAVSALVLGHLVASRLAGRPSEGRGVAGLVIAVAAWQALGVVPPSLHYQNRVPGGVLVVSLDRYLIPLLPLAVCLALWGLPAVRLRLWPAWALVAILGVAAVAGTRDFLVFQHRVQELGAQLNRQGIPNAKLDAGAQWTGMHLYENRPVFPPSRADRPWWINYFAPANDPIYVVATKPLPGYEALRRVSYSAWLSPGPDHLYVLRRVDAPRA